MATAAEGHPMPLAIVVAFAVGILAGAVNGFSSRSSASTR